MSISTTGNFFFIIFLVVVAILTAFFFYKYTLPSISKTRRVFFSILRSLILSFIILFFFQPILERREVVKEIPSIALLVDNSLSMNLFDGNEVNKDVLKKNISDKNLKLISEKANVKMFSFGENLKNINSISELKFQENQTNISNMILSLKEKLNSENIQSVLFVSDGNFTSGYNPIHIISEFKIPFYVFGLGDTTEKKDLICEKILTNNVAYVNSILPIEAKIRNIGFDREKINVQLLENGNVIETKTIIPKKDEVEIDLSFNVNLYGEGIRKFTVSISSKKNELSHKNNSLSTFVKVLKNKTKILIFSGSPNSDFAMIKQALFEDGHFDIIPFVQKNKTEFYSEKKLSTQVLDNVDCIVTIDFPTLNTQNANLEKISNAIEKNKTPFFFIGGKNIDYQKLKLFSRFLPFTVANSNPNEIQIFPQLKNENHIITSVSGKITVEIWNLLPPIFKTQTIFQSKNEAEVLVFSKLQKVNLDEPLMLINTMDFPSFAITGYGIHRWKLLNSGNSLTQNFFSDFFINSIKYLISFGKEKPIKVFTSKDFYNGNENVEFIASVFDNNLNAIEDATIEIEVEKNGFKKTFFLEGKGGGKYDNKIENLESGDYFFKATVRSKDIVLTEEKEKFSIGELNVEYLKTTMNKSLLNQIAIVTDGKFATKENFEILLKETLSQNFFEKEKEKISSVEIWNSKYSLSLIILLLSLEWFFRRRNGML